MKKFIYLFIFFMSVFFKMALDKSVLFVSLFLFPMPIMVLLIINKLDFLSYLFLIAYILIFVMYLINRSRQYWNIIKENKITKAKVIKFYSQKRRTKGRTYFANLMEFEFELKNKTVKQTDFALIKIIEDKDKMWEFDNKAVKGGLNEEEFRNNYESEFELFISESNSEIHVFKNYNLHQIYLKAQ